MRDLCGDTVPDQVTTNTHRCILDRHDPTTQHECACGRRWPTKETTTP